MKGTVYMGIYQEKRKGDLEAARRLYQEGLMQAKNATGYAYVLEDQAFE